MVKITIFTNKDKSYTGFDCIGHAGYAPEGEDIICAGVSALVINTINSIASFTKTKFSTDSNEDTGKLTIRFVTSADKETDLLMRSLVLGLQGIQDNYGNKYMNLKFEESPSGK